MLTLNILTFMLNPETQLPVTLCRSRTKTKLPTQLFKPIKDMQTVILKAWGYTIPSLPFKPSKKITVQPILGIALLSQ